MSLAGLGQDDISVIQTLTLLAIIDATGLFIFSDRRWRFAKIDASSGPTTSRVGEGRNGCAHQSRSTNDAGAGQPSSLR